MHQYRKYNKLCKSLTMQNIYFLTLEFWILVISGLLSSLVVIMGFILRGQCCGIICRHSISCVILCGYWIFSYMSIAQGQFQAERSTRFYYKRQLDIIKKIHQKVKSFNVLCNVHSQYAASLHGSDPTLEMKGFICVFVTRFTPHHCYFPQHRQSRRNFSLISRYHNKTSETLHWQPRCCLQCARDTAFCIISNRQTLVICLTWNRTKAQILLQITF